MEKKYEITSLGCNCIPRTILTRQKIKPRKADGELSCPFDLVVHEAKRVTHYLKTDFANYFDDLYYHTYKRNWFDFRGKGIWSKPDGTHFFHDKDCKQNDKEKLIQRVSQRIENLRAILKNERPIIFVHYLLRGEDVENLYKELKRIRGDKPFELAVFDFAHLLNKEIDGVHVLKEPFPNEKYLNQWNRKKCYNSSFGKEFEAKIVEFMNDIIKKYE